MITFKTFLTEEYDALVIDEKSRDKLAEIFPPKYPEFIGHHTTLKFGVKKNDDVPQLPSSMKVVGHSEEDGLEALVVELDGKSKREDGSVYHITWSLDRNKGKKPVHSNSLVSKGWKKISNPIHVSFSFNRLK